MARSSSATARFGSGFELEDYVFYLMSHAEHEYSAAMARTLKRHGIRRPIWRCLAALSQQDGMSIGELGRTALLKQSTVSRVLDRMERNGLVRRRPRKGDERVTEVHLAAPGRRLLDRVFPIAGQVYERATAGIAARDLDGLRTTLKRMRANLQARGD
jgi:DNA-binding MarR family transcriptional regulator